MTGIRPLPIIEPPADTPRPAGDAVTAGLLPMADAPLGTPPTVVPECHEEVCVTCSDQAVAVRVRSLHPGGLAIVDTGSGPEEISIALVDADVGDVVLVHAKEAIARLDPGSLDDIA